MIHAGVGGPFNGNLSFHLHFGRDARVDPLITLGEIARPHCSHPHSYSSLSSPHIKGQWAPLEAYSCTIDPHPAFIEDLYA